MMNNKALVGIASLAAMLLAGTALANPKYKFKDRSHSEYDYAQVVDVDPVTRYVTVTTPRRECWDEEVAVPSRYRGNTAPATIAGGIIGGVVGHQFGGGRGRDAATLVGTLLGSAIARDVARQQQAARYDRVRYETVQHCSVVDEVREEQRIEGYIVTYVYNGREYTTRMKERPGNEIRIRVSVTPDERRYR